MENLEYELYLGQFMKQKTLISEEWNCRGVGSKKQKWWYMVLNTLHFICSKMRDMNLVV